MKKLLTYALLLFAFGVRGQTRYEYYTTGDDDFWDSYTNNVPAQNFNPDSSFEIDYVSVKVFRVNSPGTGILRLYKADANGFPTGNVLSSGTFNGNTITTSTSGEWVNVSMSKYTLSNDSTYVLGLYTTSTSPTRILWRSDVTSPTYANGNFVYYTGGSWTDYSGWDLLFEIWGNTIGTVPNEGNATKQTITDIGYTIAVDQKMFIPEFVINGDSVGSWKKNYTYTGGAVTYSINTNYQGAFGINANTGMVSIVDASKILNKISQQDTIINLIISSKSGNREELDTLKIYVKELSYCVYIDYGYGGSESGDRSHPYNNITDVTITPGYGYFIKRGNNTTFTLNVSGIKGTATNPTILSTYGAGAKPILRGGTACISYGHWDETTGNASEHFYISELVIRDYTNFGLKSYRPSKGLQAYNVDFWNCEKTASEAVVIINTGSYADTTADHYFHIQGCTFDTASSAFLKIGVGNSLSEDMGIINNHFENGSSGYTVRFAGGRGLYFAHNYVDGQTNDDHEVIQSRIKGATYYDNYINNGRIGIILEAPADPGAMPDETYIYSNHFDNQVYHSFRGAAIELWRAGSSVPAMKVLEIKGNKFTNGVHHDGCIYLTNIDNYSIIGNSIQNADGYGIYSSSSITTDNGVIAYNEIYGTTSNAIQLNGGAETANIYNNTIDGTIDVSGASNITVRYNYYKSLSGGTASTNIDIDTITTDDHFEDYAANDYRLLSTATSAIDNGSDWGQEYDIIGVDVYNSAWDIGAYEYSPEIISDWDYTDTSLRRTIVLADFGADPDERQSMVHLLTYANEIEIEGIIGGSSYWLVEYHGREVDTIAGMNIISAYGTDLSNLRTIDATYPTADYLRSILRMGQTDYDDDRNAGMDDVGNGLSTPGSNLIISKLLEDDNRPIYMLGWGGLNTLAQAIWDLDSSGVYTTGQRDTALSRIVIYDIEGQDDAGGWIATNYPEIKFQRNYIQWAGLVWTRDGSFAYDQYNGCSTTYGSDSWIQTHVKGHGALGDSCPDIADAFNFGQDASFLYLLNNGLNYPQYQHYGGWGGRMGTTEVSDSTAHPYEPLLQTNESAYDSYSVYSSVRDNYYCADEDESYTNNIMAPVFRWRKAIFTDFQARMDWADGTGSNVAPIAKVGTDSTKNIIYVNAQPGGEVTLNASNSRDANGNSLTYKWYVYEEPGTYGYAGDIDTIIANTAIASTTLTVPEDATEGENIHVILEVTDNGTPALTSYRRLIITAQEAEIADTTNYEHHLFVGTDYASNGYSLSQSFTVGNIGDNECHSIDSLQIKFYTEDVTDSVTFRIYEAVNDTITGDALSIGAVTSGFPITGTIVNIPMSSYPLETNTSYVIIMKVHGPGFIFWAQDKDNGYSGGKSAYLYGGKWNIQNNYDCYFQVFGTESNDCPATGYTPQQPKLNGRNVRFKLNGRYVIPGKR